MTDYYSDEDASSLDTPPPPPPSEIHVTSPRSGGKGRQESSEQTDDEKYYEQLNIFKGMFDFQRNPPPIEEKDEENFTSDDDDEESAEAPPPPKPISESEGEPFWKRIKRPMLYGSVAVVLLLLIIVILTIGIATQSFQGGGDSSAGSLGASSSGPSGPSYTPEETERASRLREYLMSVGAEGTAIFNDPISAESQALAWMQYDDPVVLDPAEFDNHLRIDQRFALLTLWFQSDFEWFNQRNWLTEDECSWHGVQCILVTPGLRRNLKELDHPLARKLQDGDKLVALLDLERNNLQGRIPPDLSLLRYLKTLNLSRNGLSGVLPTTLSSLQFLEEVYLDNNALTGELKLDFSTLPELVVFDISNNSMEGSIPATMWSGSLQEILLDDNDFVGALPDNVANLDLGK
jgi:hypothetical protein